MILVWIGFHGMVFVIQTSTMYSSCVGGFGSSLILGGGAVLPIDVG